MSPNFNNTCTENYKSFNCFRFETKIFFKFDIISFFLPPWGILVGHSPIYYNSESASPKDHAYNVWSKLGQNFQMICWKYKFVNVHHAPLWGPRLPSPPIFKTINALVINWTKIFWKNENMNFPYITLCELWPQNA